MIIATALDFCDNEVAISKNNFRNGCTTWIPATQGTIELNNFSDFCFARARSYLYTAYTRGAHGRYFEFILMRRLTAVMSEADHVRIFRNTYPETERSNAPPALGPAGRLG